MYCTQIVFAHFNKLNLLMRYSQCKNKSSDFMAESDKSLVTWESLCFPYSTRDEPALDDQACPNLTCFRKAQRAERQTARLVMDLSNNSLYSSEAERQLGSPFSTVLKHLVIFCSVRRRPEVKYSSENRLKKSSKMLVKILFKVCPFWGCHGRLHGAAQLYLRQWS